MSAQRYQPRRRTAIGTWLLVLASAVGCLPEESTARLKIATLNTATSPKPNRILVVMTSAVQIYEAPLRAFIERVPAQYRIVDLDNDPLRHRERLEALVRTFKPHLAWTLGTAAGQAVREVAPELPLVFSMAIRYREFYRPGKATTGVTLQVPPQNLLTQLKLLAPAVKRVAALYDPKVNPDLAKNLAQVAALFGVKVALGKVHDSSDTLTVLDGLLSKVDALWLPPDPTVLTPDNFKKILARCRARRIPVVVFSAELARAGATLSLSVNFPSIGSQAAVLAHQILTDKKRPGTIPIAPPLGTRVVVNVKAAKAIGLTISDDLMETADELIGM